jgi:hypothetical protein
MGKKLLALCEKRAGKEEGALLEGFLYLIFILSA